MTSFKVMSTNLKMYDNEKKWGLMGKNGLLFLESGNVCWNGRERRTVRTGINQIYRVVQLNWN